MNLSRHLSFSNKLRKGFNFLHIMSLFQLVKGTRISSLSIQRLLDKTAEARDNQPFSLRIIANSAGRARQTSSIPAFLAPSPLAPLPHLYGKTGLGDGSSGGGCGEERVGAPTFLLA